MSLPHLHGRTAVITGASRGIGAGLAAEFAARGMNLALCARGDCPVPREAEDRTLVARVDVQDEVDVKAFSAAVIERFNTVDLWINNAGILKPIAPLREIDLGEFRNHLSINLIGVFLGTRAFVHAHRERVAASGAAQDACLINISSGASWSGYAGWSAYCSGKAGLDRLTESVQLEEADTGLRAYAVAPGVVDTAMQDLIRSSTPEQFPMVDKFHEMKANEAFNTTSFVAEHLLSYAFDPSARPAEVCVRVPAESEA
ncbi:MAG: SDR family NAD(P)-dependent oxidoreductase [Planctomycetes bacterium]|nr:SDR family NAD(P)-dependent oxidoreductase [Planctomycetota bacterium]